MSKTSPAILGLTATLATHAVGQEERPNVLFISVDDLNFPKYHYPEKRSHRLPYEDWMYREADWGGFEMSDEEFGGDYAVTEWVIDQMAVDRDQPFFLVYGIYRPHLPWFVPQRHVDVFPLDEVQMSPGMLAAEPYGWNDLAPGEEHAAKHEEMRSLRWKVAAEMR